MKYNTFMVKNTIFFTLLLFLQACGSSPDADKSHETSSINQKSMVIDENNYVKLSQYYFNRQSRFLQMKKGRATKLHPAYPGANSVANHTISVSMVTPFDKYIQKMTLSQDSVRVVVSVDSENNRVTISYGDQKGRDSKSMTISEFENINEEEAL